MLLQILSANNSSVPQITDVPDPVQVLDVPLDITLPSIYWFKPYLASDYPEITCDKTYFFLWSTDHDQAGAMDGGIWWGKGNNLDLSDFTEEALVIDGYQAETPKLWRFPGETRPIYLYYHTIQSNPINVGTAQETNLITTAGGNTLDAVTWTQESNPLGLNGGETHTGYFNFWEQENGDLKGTHFTGGSNLPVSLPDMVYSVLDADGLGVTRGSSVDLENNIPTGFYWSPSFGEFFKLYDKWWWLGTINDRTTGGADAELAIFEANSNFELTRLVSLLNQSDATSYARKTWSIYIDLNSKIAHCYLNNKFDSLWYTTFNLAQLQFQ